MNPQNLFTITPMSRKLSLAPGESYAGTVSILNPSTATADFTYVVTVAPYSVENGTYNADLATETTRSQMVNWITIDNPRGTLAPNEKVDVAFTIKVPSDAPGGGQYAAIMVGSDITRNSTEGLSVQNEYGMASIIYAKINGEIKRGGEVVSNNVPGFITDTPLKLTTEVKNDGNIHETVKVAVNIKNMIGNGIIYPTAEDTGELTEVVMPETTYKVVRDINEMPSIGIYEVSQTVTYLGQTNTEAKVVVACPVWLMATILIVIAFIISIIIFKFRRRKHRLIVT